MKLIFCFSKIKLIEYEILILNYILNYNTKVKIFFILVKLILLIYLIINYYLFFLKEKNKLFSFIFLIILKIIIPIENKLDFKFGNKIFF